MRAGGYPSARRYQLPYESAVYPTPSNDIVDTLSIGRCFKDGDLWYNSLTRQMMICVDSTATAALWRQVSNQPHVAVVNPLYKNDGVDTASLGRRFNIGDTWLNSTGGNNLWVCVNAATNAAEWLILGGNITESPNGFATTATSLIAWNNALTRVEISPVAVSFDYYYQGVRYTKSVMQSVAINPVQSGLWIIYFEAGTLKALNFTLTGTNYFHMCTVAKVVWNSVASELVSFQDERHGIIMDGSTHEYLHKTIGMRYEATIGGLTLTPPGTLPLSGAADYHCKVQLANGTLRDEDLVVSIEHKDVPLAADIWKQNLGITATLTNYVVGTKTVTLSAPHSFKAGQVLTFFTSGGVYRGEDTVFADTSAVNDVVLVTGIGALIATDVLLTYTVFPVIYRDGVTGDWRRKVQTQPNEQFPFIVGATPVPKYNNPAGPWTQVEVTNTYFVAAWIIGTSDIQYPIQVLMGQRQDATYTAAQDNNKFETILWGDFPFAEIKVLYRLIYSVNTAYTNTVNARLREIIDFRNVSASPSTTYTATTHSVLTGLTYETAGHTGFGRTPYEAGANPLVTNDDLDTAAVGRYFRNGDLWLNTVSRYTFICTNPATGAAVWRQVAPLPIPSLLNKNMACVVTAADFAQATATVVAVTPALGGYVQVMLNGVQQPVGDAVRTRNCYFSGDGGANARAITAIVAGDTIHWVGSVAGHELAVTDILDLNFLV